MVQKKPRRSDLMIVPNSRPLRDPANKLLPTLPLSDFTPNWGPGMFMPDEGEDSLRRCYRAVVGLFCRSAEFGPFEWRKVRHHIHPHLIREVVRNYWWDKRIDRRTTGSDVKRDLGNFIKALKKFDAEMSAVPVESRHVINWLLVNKEITSPVVRDFFSDCERINKLILKSVEPIINTKFIKQRRLVSVENACRKLIAAWQLATKEKFVRAYGKRTKRGQRVAEEGDDKEFSEDGLHFLHVVMQAIDPEIKAGQIATSVRSSFKRQKQTR